MTHIHDDPETFAQTALKGFCDLYPDHVRHVPDGAVRSTATPAGKVAVVIGGGSGHYPAFAGYVGPGGADAVVAGDIFASPSTQAIARVGKLADRGGGIIFGYGNYAGDVLNFGAACERLGDHGIDARNLIVTDDIASADPEAHHQRRGVAGDVVVFKIAGAAAEAGHDIDGVMRLAEHANRRTLSFGVAFDGCTLPGAREPLFHVEKGRVGVGLGIHGEPGIDEIDALPAADLAALLVDRLLAERPEGWSGRAAVILNGLGATKYEELFVLWTHVSDRLRKEGIDLVAPICGEFVTSLDMAGCSLTVCFLDDELEPLWQAPADSPALRKGVIEPRGAAEPLPDTVEEIAPLPEASAASRDDAGRVLQMLRDMDSALADAEHALGQLDAIAGDGDHGRGMRRGSAAALAAAEDAASAGAGVRSLLARAADSWADRAGGTSGAIWGLILRGLSDGLSDDTGLSRTGVAEGARIARDRVERLGGAKPGDKTLVDALVPLVETLRQATEDGAEAAEIWRRAADAATDAARETAPMRPRLGRARPLAERSIGHADPGAVSLAMCARVIADRLAGSPGAEAERTLVSDAIED
ncbi:dihydroxyacetone kinase family protein [Tranquillimonas rosea]|uniref:dihydroxyacetone kinase family protein n=1 Tax=Tranquillimonas rosea TaxID=641238 RepID=UPI003BA85882